MGAEIFTLFGRIVTNASQVMGELGKVDSAAARTGASMSLSFAKANAAIQQNAGAIRAAGVAMTAGGAAIAASLFGAVRTAADFETQMRNVDSIMKLSTAQFKSTSAAVIALSLRLPQSAATLAAGLYDIASSGFEGAEGLTVLEASAMAASAGISDTATAARAIAGAINAYGMSAADAGHISDVLFKTVDRGVISFPELAGGIGEVLASAAAVGVPLEEVGAAIATMTKAGVPAAQTMTSLNRIMVTFLNPPKELAKALKTVTDESALQIIQTKGLAGAVEILNKVTGDSPELLAAVGLEQRSLRAAMSLTREGGAIYRHELELQANAAGATQAALERQAEGFNYQFGLMKNQMSAAAIGIGGQLMPALRPLVALVGRIAKGVAAWMKEHPGLTRALVVSAAAVAGLMLALGPLLIALPSLMSVIVAIVLAGGLGAVSAGLTAIGAAAAGLAAPVAIAIGVIAALAAAVWGGKKAWDAYSGAVKPMTAEQRALNARVSDAYEVVEELGKKTHLTVEEHKRYYAALQELAQIYPDVVKGYDAQGEAIFDLTELVKKARAAHEDYILTLKREMNLERLSGIVELVKVRQQIADLTEKIERQKGGAPWYLKWAEDPEGVAKLNAELRQLVALETHLTELERARRAGAKEPEAKPTPKPTAPTAAELAKELALAREILAGKLDAATTDTVRIALQKELIALLTRYGHEAALEELTRLQLLHEAQNLQRDMGKEAFAIAESENAHNIRKAMSFAALAEALETQSDLYQKMATSGRLTDADRQAAADKMLDTEKTLQSARAEYAASNLSVEKAMVATYEQERAVREHAIRIQENQLATERLTGDEERKRFADIKALQKDLAAFDEQHLQNVHAINLADAQTYEQRRALLSVELARQRMIEAEPVTAVLDEAAHEAAHERVRAIRAAIVALNIQEINQQVVLRALAAGNRQEINASFEERIAYQQLIIDNWKEMGLFEDAAGAATEARLNLEREQRQALLAYDLALIDREIAATAQGYEKKNELLQAAVAAEIAAGGKILDQIELRGQIEQNAYAAIAEARGELTRSGEWELMTLQEQDVWLGRQLEKWTVLADEALPDVRHELDAMDAAIHAMEPTWAEMFRQVAKGWQTAGDSGRAMISDILNAFQTTIRGMMTGVATWRDFFLAAWNAILDYISRSAMADIVKWAEEKLGKKPSDDSGKAAANTNLLAGTAMGMAAEWNKEAARVMGLAALAMQLAANTMAAAGAGGGAGGAGGGIFGLLSGMLGGGGGGVDADAYGQAFELMGAIPTFAAGGIVTKPMLAVVGEVPELITPLSQVAAAGAGGSAPMTVNLSIQAIDTQSGIDFLLQNQRAIGQALHAALSTNSPVGRRNR